MMLDACMCCIRRTRAMIVTARGGPNRQRMARPSIENGRDQHASAVFW